MDTCVCGYERVGVAVGEWVRVWVGGCAHAAHALAAFCEVIALGQGRAGRECRVAHLGFHDSRESRPGRHPSRT